MQNERLTPTVSQEELCRRWELVKAVMSDRGLDYLIVQNNESFLGGTLRWFTDLSARHQMPMTLIFAADGSMTTIVCGAEPQARNGPPPWAQPAITRRLGDVYFPNLSYTESYDARLTAGILAKKPHASIGLVECGQIPMSFYLHLRGFLPDAVFSDATDWVAALMAVKSEEEIALIRESAAIGDRAVAELSSIVRSGIREKDVYADLHYFLAKQGSERAIVMIGSAPQDTPVAFSDLHFQNRLIRPGDHVEILIELSGPAGYWTEIHRPVLVGGETTPHVRAAYEQALRFQAALEEQLRDGVSAASLWDAFSRMLTESGHNPPVRSFSHAMGLSYLERPNVRPDETWALRAGMNLALHPAVEHGGVIGFAFDNYLIRETGAERLHTAPREIIFVD